VLAGEPLAECHAIASLCYRKQRNAGQLMASLLC